MHRTIVPNKIIVIIYSCLFFLANIYRPSLGKVQLGRPNPTQLQRLNFYPRKKNILLRIICTTNPQILIFNFDFHLLLKNILINLYKKMFFKLYI